MPRAHTGVGTPEVMDNRGRLHKNIHFIHLYVTADSKQRKALTETISRDQLLTLCEIILNTKVGNIEKPDFFNKHLDFLETLADTKVSVSLKQEILIKSATYRGIVKRLLSHFLTCAKNI